MKFYTLFIYYLDTIIRISYLRKKNFINDAYYACSEDILKTVIITVGLRKYTAHISA